MFLQPRREVLGEQGGAAWRCCWYSFEARVPSSPLVDIIIVHDPVKVRATSSPPPASQPLIPLTPHSSTPCSWAHSHSLTASCAIHAAGGPAVASSTSMLDLPKLACPSCSLMSSRSSRPPPSRYRRLCSEICALRAAAAAYEIENGKCEDVVSRVSLCSDSTGIYSTRRRRWPARRLTPFSNMGIISLTPFKNRANSLHTPTHTLSRHTQS